MSGRRRTRGVDVDALHALAPSLPRDVIAAIAAEHGDDPDMAQAMVVSMVDSSGGGGGGGGGHVLGDGRTGFGHGGARARIEPAYVPGAAPRTVQVSPIGSVRSIAVRRGDIVLETADAIVNAANSQLAHGSGVAGAIRRHGGDVLQDVSDVFVAMNGEVPVGTAVSVGPEVGRLSCKLLIHSVGPTFSNGRLDDAALLRQCVVSSMDVASAAGLESIALPAISSGIFGFPKPLCAASMIAAARGYFLTRPLSSLKEIRFTNNDAETVDVFLTALGNEVAAAPAVEVLVPPAPVASRAEPSVTTDAVDNDAGAATVVPRTLPRRLAVGHNASDGASACAVGGASVFVDACNGNYDLSGKMGAGLVAVTQRPIREAATAATTPTRGSPPFVFLPAAPPARMVPLVVVVCPVFDFSMLSVEALRARIEAVLMFIDTARETSDIREVTLPLLGTGSLAFPPILSARVIAEATYEFLRHRATRIVSVTLLEDRHTTLFVDHVKRIDAASGEMRPAAQPLALSPVPLVTPPAPENETPAQRRARERAAAEARLAATLVGEQIGLQ